MTSHTLSEAKAAAERARMALLSASYLHVEAPDEPHSKAAAELELQSAARRYGDACALVSILERSRQSGTPGRRRGDK